MSNNKEPYCTIGQTVRRTFGGEFGTVGCDGTLALLTNCSPVPRRIDAASAPRVQEALIAAACRELKIDVPRLGKDELRQIWSAAGWNCREGRLCASCSERKWLAPALGGKTIAEFLAAR